MVHRTLSSRSRQHCSVQCSVICLLVNYSKQANESSHTRSILTTDRMVMPSWLPAYEAECKKNNKIPDVVKIPNSNAKGFWIGNKETATYNMVWYHSGGFVVPGAPQLNDLMKSIVRWSNDNVAIFCVAYTLAPGAHYPVQIGEAVEALRFVLELPGRSPQRTIIAGDSAGGNLVLAVLSHISGHAHPQSSIVRPLDFSGNLFGAIVVAPWVSSETERFPSAKQFENRDIIHAGIGQYWIKTYKNNNTIKDDNYIVPELAKPEWWKNAKLSSFLVCAGEHEILRDSIISWAQHFQEGAPDVEFKLVIGKKESHCAPLISKGEKAMIGNEEVYQEAAIRHWIKSRLA